MEGAAVQVGLCGDWARRSIMSVRPESEETERDTWQRQFHRDVQPPLHVKDRIREAREALRKPMKETS
jgi:hypothetical protein